MSFNPRSIIHLNIPAFPIAVERVKSPRLRDRPVALVLGTGTQSRTISVSDEARAAGVHPGMLLRTARRICRDLFLLNPDPPLYHRAGQAIKLILDDFSPLIEPVRSGRFFLDYTGCRRLFGEPEQAVECARRRILKQLRLPSLTGLAVNKLVSRVASGDSQPRGFLEVEPGVEAPFLGPHPVKVLPAVDEKIRKILTELNVQTVEEVRPLKWEHLTTIFGYRGVVLSRQAQGIDPSPVRPADAPPQVQMIEELAETSNDKELLSALVRRMIVAGCRQLRQNGSIAQEIYIMVFYADGKSAGNYHRFRNAQDSDALWLKVGNDLFQQTLTRRVRVRRLEVTFSRLQGQVRQLPLLLNYTAHPLENASRFDLNETGVIPAKKIDRSLHALESVIKRYGVEALKWGS